MLHHITRMEKTADLGELCLKRQQSFRQFSYQNTTSRENRHGFTTSSVAKASLPNALKRNRFDAGAPATRVLKLLGRERVGHRFGTAHANNIADLRRRIVDMDRMQILRLAQHLSVVAPCPLHQN